MAVPPRQAAAPARLVAMRTGAVQHLIFLLAIGVIAAAHAKGNSDRERGDGRVWIVSQERPWASVATAVMLQPDATPADAGETDPAAGTPPTATPDSTAVPALVLPPPLPLLATLTLEQKIGQMLMLGFGGTDGSGAIGDLVRRRHTGNVVLLGPNVRTPAQLQALSEHLQNLARTANGGVGMLIAVDQEGGTVQRLHAAGFPWLPSARQTAAERDPALVTRRAVATAHDLRGVGINTNLAPVLDVNDNPANPVIGTRAFGTDVQTVTAFGLAALEGLAQGGVASVVKHFPGHGNTAQDSHFTLPYVAKSDTALRAVELAPFRAAVQRGVDAVMVAHVVYTAWDGRLPASLSPRIVTGILREELGFSGVVITDDLNMGAITGRYGPGEAALLAVEAGVDMLLIAGPPASQVAMFDALLAAVRDGRIAVSRIDASVERILALKQKQGLVAESR